MDMVDIKRIRLQVILTILANLLAIRIPTPPQSSTGVPSGISAFTDGSSTVEVIVGTNNSSQSYGTLSEIAAKNGGKVTDSISMDASNAIVVNMPVSGASAFVGQVRASGVSKYVEPNGQYHVDLTPNDPYWGNQWGLQKIGADHAWDTTIGDSDVLGSGYRYRHRL